MDTDKVILIIMDGWGIGKGGKGDAISHSNTPFVNSLYKNYTNSTLKTCGEDVGLPEGQMGNSEVGHLNLGAGRIVYQELQRININIKNGSFAQNKFLLDALKHAKDNNKKLHLMGLVSDGGVHSHINHLKALLSICREHDLKNVLVHAFTDGRDTDPKSGLGFIEELINHTKETTGAVATIVGRYYAMDRDKRWERIKVAYDAMVNNIGAASKDLLKTINEFYEKGITDEFLTPIINKNLENSNIENGDVVISFNFRTDRCREITDVLSQKDFPEYGMKALNLYFCTMTEYDHSFKNVHTFFET
ncbi:MAG: 2,3-bisphosphoglycerate-independent phosphoglycerate mutase, partial [Ferruginibacter sp.]